MTPENRLLWRCTNCKICEFCGAAKEEDGNCLVYCESCDRAFHMFCVVPKLKEIPIGHWYCKSCVNCTECYEKEKEEDKNVMKIDFNDDTSNNTDYNDIDKYNNKDKNDDGNKENKKLHGNNFNDSIKHDEMDDNKINIILNSEFSLEKNVINPHNIPNIGPKKDEKLVEKNVKNNSERDVRHTWGMCLSMCHFCEVKEKEEMQVCTN